MDAEREKLERLDRLDRECELAAAECNAARQAVSEAQARRDRAMGAFRAAKANYAYEERRREEAR